MLGRWSCTNVIENLFNGDQPCLKRTKAFGVAALECLELLTQGAEVAVCVLEIALHLDQPFRVALDVGLGGYDARPDAAGNALILFFLWRFGSSTC